MPDLVWWLTEIPITQSWLLLDPGEGSVSMALVEKCPHGWNVWWCLKAALSAWKSSPPPFSNSLAAADWEQLTECIGQKCNTWPWSPCFIRCEGGQVGCASFSLWGNVLPGHTVPWSTPGHLPYLIISRNCTAGDGWVLHLLIRHELSEKRVFWQTLSHAWHCP